MVNSYTCACIMFSDIGSGMSSYGVVGLLVCNMYISYTAFPCLNIMIIIETGAHPCQNKLFQITWFGSPSFMNKTWIQAKIFLFIIFKNVRKYLTVIQERLSLTWLYGCHRLTMLWLPKVTNTVLFELSAMLTHISALLLSESIKLKTISMRSPCNHRKDS